MCSPVDRCHPLVVVVVPGLARREGLDFEEGFGVPLRSAVVHFLLARREVRGMQIWDDCMHCPPVPVTSRDVVDVGGDVWVSHLSNQEC